MKNLAWQNWQHPPRAILVLIAGIISSLTAFTPEFLKALHEAPFPVSDMVDLWIKWILKMLTLIFAGICILTKTPEIESKNSSD